MNLKIDRIRKDFSPIHVDISLKLKELEIMQNIQMN